MPGDLGGVAGPSRAFKKVRVSKRTFAEAAAAAPSFGVDSMSEDTEMDWLKDGFQLESDDESDTRDEIDGIPIVRIPKAIREELVEPWRSALILKFLGKSIGFSLLQQKLLRLWNLKGKLELIDLGENCYVARFELADDCKHVLLDGPWKILDNYIVPQRWRPDFDPTTAKVEKMAVWVRLPGLPVEYFHEDILKLILERVGTPLKLDRTTAGVERGRFARAAVEIDLAKPLVSMVMVRSRLQRVEFEGLHVICFDCGEVGHRSANYGKKAKPNEEQPSQETNENVQEDMIGSVNQSQGGEEFMPEARFGPWMIVQSRTKKAGASASKVGEKVV